MRKGFYLSRQDCETYLTNLKLDPVIYAAFRASLQIMNDQHSDGFWVETPLQYQVSA